MVLGTPTTGSPASARRLAPARVPSPPIAITASMLLLSRTLAMFSGPPWGPSNGLVREVPRMVPPSRARPRTLWRGSSMMSPSTTPRQPSRKPTNSWPKDLMPCSTAPRITALSPGQSPPLVISPIRMMGSVLLCGVVVVLTPSILVTGGSCGAGDAPAHGRVP